jgi:HSP20 family protein
MANEPRLWSPLKELDRFRRDFDDLFDRFLGGRMGPLVSKGTESPALESFIDNGKLMIRADLPGVDPKDVEITVTGDTLTLRGKREERSEEKGRNYLHREVTYGSFERSMRLPAGVKADQVKAAYRNGVLELSVPVPTEAAPRKVPIEIERK